LEPEGEIEVIDDRPPTSIDAETPLVRAVVGAHTEVYGTKPAYGGVPGTTDATILVRNAHPPVVVYGPGGKWIAHQADEYVEVYDIIRAAKVYLLAAHTLLNADLSQSSRPPCNYLSATVQF
jgi:succinyl-diaminopimelate desuccinylase